jgi:hypothetical protein
MEHELTRVQARRIAVAAQLLTDDRPTDVLDTVRRLSLVQLDRTTAVAPSPDVVLWSRIGSDYDVRDLADLVDEQRLVDLRGELRPVEDVALYRAEMRAWPGSGELTDWQVRQREWVRTNDACRQDILELLRADGPLAASQLPDTCVTPWRSSGWNDDRNVVMMLDLLVQRGEVAAAGRRGRERLWDLASRVYPDDPMVPADEARLLRDERRLGALGIARSTAPASPVEPLGVGEAGEPATIAGVRGRWRVDPTYLDVAHARRFPGRTALLSPLDRLIHDRRRMRDVFAFDYQLEMYKPAAQRRWGYWALPVLHGDELVGKVDATADRGAGVLRVDAVHEDVAFTAAMTAAVDRELLDLAEWLRLDLHRVD